MTFIGFNGTFLIQHWLGVEGMPRRYGDYLPGDGFTLENQISSFFALVLGISTLVYLFNFYWTARYAPKVTLPRIRSERPAFDLHHPELADWDSAGYLASLDDQNTTKGAIS